MVLLPACGDRVTEIAPGESADTPSAGNFEEVITLEPGDAKTLSGRPLVIRDYPLPEGFFSSSLADGKTAEDLLRAAGVEFSSRATAAFDRQGNLLTVKNYRDQLLVTEAVVDSWRWIERDAQKEKERVVEKKLKETVLPEVNFQDTPFSEALAFLEAESAKYDESENGGKGVKIELEKIETLSFPKGGEGFGFDPGNGDESGWSPADTEITLRLSRVPLGEAIRYTTSLAQMRYFVNEFGVRVTALHGSPGPWLETNVFAVSPAFGLEIENYDSQSPEGIDPFAPLAGTEVEEGSPLRERTAKGLLEAVGVYFEPGAEVNYDKARFILTVRNSPDQNELVEAYVQSLQSAGFADEADEDRTSRFTEKLHAIRIPKVSYREEQLWQVISDLNRRSRLYDTRAPLWARGVPVQVDRSRAESEIDQSDPFRFHSLPPLPTITLEKENGTLFEILKEVARVSGLEFEIDAGGVVLTER
jgi:hypothetical protein